MPQEVRDDRLLSQVLNVLDDISRITTVRLKVE